MDFGIFHENASKPIKLKFGVKQILSYEYLTLASDESIIITTVFKKRNHIPEFLMKIRGEIVRYLYVIVLKNEPTCQKKMWSGILMVLVVIGPVFSSKTSELDVLVPKQSKFCWFSRVSACFFFRRQQTLNTMVHLFPPLP